VPERGVHDDGDPARQGDPRIDCLRQAAKNLTLLSLRR
jgi:hypothetical protein